MHCPKLSNKDASFESDMDHIRQDYEDKVASGFIYGREHDCATIMKEFLEFVLTVLHDNTKLVVCILSKEQDSYFIPYEQAKNHLTTELYRRFHFSLFPFHICDPFNEHATPTAEIDFDPQRV